MPDSIASAIASAPAAPSPAPAAPAPVASPAPVAAPIPASSPASTAAPVAAPAPSGPQPPTPPNPREHDAGSWFPADAKYREDLAKFKEENPGVEIPEIKPEAPQEAPQEAKTEETPAAETKPEDKPAETQEESFSLDEEPSLTPQALNDLIKGKPEREAFLNSDPELKNALFKLTREHGELQQFRGIFPGKDSAEFAKKTSDRFVTLQAKIQTAEDSVSMNSAIDDFAQEFAVIGADGKPVMDEDGTPQYADDFYRFAESWIERWAKHTISDAEQQMKAAEAAGDSDKLAYWKDQRTMGTMALEDIHPPENANDPDLSGVPENLRAGIEARLAEAKRIEAQNLEAQGKTKSQAQQAKITQARSDFFAQAGERTGPKIQQTLDAMRKAGVLIPEWQLQSTVPGTNIPAFYQAVGNAIDASIKADPYTRKNMADLEARAHLSPAHLQEWVQAYDQHINATDSKGVSLIRGIVAKIVRGHGTQVVAQQGAQTAPTTTARPEPKGGGAVQPKTMSADEAWAMAQKLNAKEIRGWENMTSSEKLAANIDRRSKILTAR